MEASRAELNPSGRYNPAPEAEVLKLKPPHEREGVFKSRLRTYDTELKSLEQTNETECKDGTINFEIAVMDDGTPYPLVTGTPKEIRSDTAIVFSTAWLTSTKGHNRHTLHRMMRKGYPTIMIGPESQLRNREQSFIERLSDAREMTLPRTVHNMNRVLDKKLANMHNVRPNEIIVLGESRGAMTGFGFDVQQYAGERKVAYADLTAPCFARKPLLEEALPIASQLVSEVKTLGSLAINMFGLKLMKQKSGTLHKDPEYYAKEIIKTWNLMNGQAGELGRATRAISENVPMHIRVFNGDGWSQRDDWVKLFEGRPLIKVELVEGNHLDIAEPTTLGRITTRLSNLSEQRGYDGSFGSVDYDEVFAAAEQVSKPKRPSVTRVGQQAVKSLIALKI